MPLRLHIVLSLGALILAFGIGLQAIENSPALRFALLGTTADIGVEHADSLSMRLEYATRGTAAMIHIEHDGEHPIAVSVPSLWRQQEVTGAELKGFRQDDSVFGYARWRMPAKSGMTFFIPRAPGHIVIHHPSAATLKLSTTNVNLENDTVEKNIFLMQEGSVRIW